MIADVTQWALLAFGIVVFVFLAWAARVDSRQRARRRNEERFIAGYRVGARRRHGRSHQ